MPLLACFPVCMTLTALGLIGAVMLLFGLGNRLPDDDQPARPPRDLGQKMGPPPVWVFLLMLLAVALVMLALGWYWPE